MCLPRLKAGLRVPVWLRHPGARSVGFCEGVHMGSNTVAAVMRIGVTEMRKFAQVFFDDILEETFLDSCGSEDLVTTCKGGAARKTLRGVRQALMESGAKLNWTSYRVKTCRVT
eukprot:GHVU01029701.1.p2 GENE.GHVU01029701.1~~GHVU01029701.1.p2  ORF type:complete len:114 (-),score=16.06 GHVU01029701.1:117-458(-)